MNQIGCWEKELYRLDNTWVEVGEKQQKLKNKKKKQVQDVQKCQLHEYQRSGSKAMSVEEDLQKERAKVGNINGQSICLNQ